MLAKYSKNAQKTKKNIKNEWNMSRFQIRWLDFRYTFGFVNPHDFTFVKHSNLHSNAFYFRYIFVIHSVFGTQTPDISIDFCYTFTTHSVSHSKLIITHSLQWACI